MILEADRLSHWYGSVLALNDVSLALPPGITGLLGPNGAGKTSFLRIAAGLVRPSGGSLRVLGENPWCHSRLAKRLGYCPEQDGFFEWMTGREFVRTLARLRGIGSDSAVEEALECVRLQEVANRAVRTYSRGMRQRLKIAQAIVHGPEFLILDEPLTGTDPLVRQDLLELIRKLGREGRSLLVSSHVLHEVEAMTSQIVVLHRGRLVAIGGVETIRGLIDLHPHTVRIRTNRPREFAARLVHCEEVLELRIEENVLEARTRCPNDFYSKLPRWALESGCAIEEITSEDDTLDAVFRYLTER